MFLSKNKKSLRQGEQFNIMKKMFNQNIKHIGKNTYTGIVEGLDDDKTSMEQLKEEFEKTLLDYEEVYKLHLTEKMSNDDKYKFIGKTVEWDGDLYYITKKGIMRQLWVPPRLDKDWPIDSGKREMAHNCPRVMKPALRQEEKNMFKIGQPLKAILDQNSTDGTGYTWQKCTDPWHFNGAMFIKRRGANNDLAWIDDEGKKYNFKSNIDYNETHDTCPKQKAPEVVYTIEFSNPEMIPTITPDLTKESPCPGITNNTENRVIALNDKLIRLAINMRDEITNIENRNGDTKNSISKANSSLEDIMKILKEKRDEIEKLNIEIHSLNGNIKDTKGLVKAINLHYFGWGLSLVTLMFLIMKYKK